MAAALPYVLRFVTCLLESGNDTPSTIHVVRDAVERLNRRDDHDRLTRLLLFLAQHEVDEVKRVHTMQQFIHHLATMKMETPDVQPVCIDDLKHASNCPFSVILASDFDENVLVPGEGVSVSISISSSLPLPIASSYIRLRLLRLSVHSTSSSSTTHARTPTSPSFVIDNSDGESRLLQLETRRVRAGEDDEIVLRSQHPHSIEAGPLGQSVKVWLLDGGVCVTLPPQSVQQRVNPLLLTVHFNPCTITARPLTAAMEAGVSQTIRVSLGAGSSPVETSKLKVTVANDEEDDVEFLSEDGLWESLVLLTVEGVEKDEKVHLDVKVCMPLKGHVQRDIMQRRLLLEWGGVWTVVPVQFNPLFTAAFMNSHLEYKLLLQCEIGRPLSSPFTVVPVEATLTSSLTAQPSITPLCHIFQPLPPCSVCNVSWLVHASADFLHLPFTIRMKYRVQRRDGGVVEEHVDREYEYTLNDTITVKRVEYEVCSQVLSQQPGAALCRVGSLCHVLVSVRSLSHAPEAESLIIVLTADEEHWEVTEKSKVFSLKESGLGQVSLAVLPKVTGFLPYPSVHLYPAHGSLRSEDRFWSDVSELSYGPPLFVFERTAGKQIHVLGASTSEPSIGKGEKRTIKKTLQKFLN